MIAGGVMMIIISPIFFFLKPDIRAAANLFLGVGLVWWGLSLKNNKNPMPPIILTVVCGLINMILALTEHKK